MTEKDFPVLIWVGRFSAIDGYGEVTRRHCDSLTKLGVPIIRIDSQSCDVEYQNNSSHFVETVERSSTDVRIDFKQDVTPYCVIHERPDRSRNIRVDGPIRTGLTTVTEIDEVPKDWIDTVAAWDDFLPTKSEDAQRLHRTFSSLIFPHPAKSFVEPVQVAELETFDLKAGEYFVSVVSRLERRDIFGLLSGYLQFCENWSAHPRKLPKLAIKCSHRDSGSIREAIQQHVERSDVRELADQIILLSERLSDKSIDSLIAASLGYISVDVAAGWDLPLFDALANGVPAVGVLHGGSGSFTGYFDDLYLGLKPTGNPIPLTSDTSHKFYTNLERNSFSPSDLADALRTITFSADQMRRAPVSDPAHIEHPFQPRQVSEALLTFVGEKISDDARPSGVSGQIRVAKHQIWSELTPNPIGKRFDNGVDERTAFRIGHPIQSLKDLAEHAATIPSRERSPSQRFFAEIRAEKKSLQNLSVSALRFAKNASRSSVKRAKNWLKAPLLMGCVRRQLGGFSRPSFLLQSKKFSDYSRRRAVAGPRAIALSNFDRKKFETLRQESRRKPLVIVGNAPSINQLDFEELQSFDTFGFNHIDLLFERTRWRPTYYTTLDWRVGPECIPNLSCYSGTTKLLLPTRFRGMPEKELESSIYWYSTRSIDYGGRSVWEGNPFVGFPGRGSVVYTAICIGVYLGYSEIQLVGVDLEYSIPKSVKQIGDSKFNTGVATLLESTQDDDPNHFDPRYFGAGKKWHDPNTAEMQRALTSLYRHLESQGIQITNASPFGSLQDIPREVNDKLWNL